MSYLSHLQRWKVKSINYKKIPQEKFLKNINLRLSNFGSEIKERRKKIRTGKSLILGLCHSLLMDLGQDQQQQSTAHSGGVSSGRVCGCGC